MYYATIERGAMYEPKFCDGTPLPPTYDPDRAGRNDGVSDVYHPPQPAKLRERYNRAWDRAFRSNA